MVTVTLYCLSRLLKTMIQSSLLNVALCPIGPGRSPSALLRPENDNITLILRRPYAQNGEAEWKSTWLRLLIDQLVNEASK